jgi:tRNA-specific adenosine deaminase 3
MIEKLKILIKDRIHIKEQDKSDLSSVIPEPELMTIKLPYTQPLDDTQYNYCKSFWHLTYLRTSTSEIAYSHTKEELDEISMIINSFLFLNKHKGVCSVLYDPISKNIIEKSEDDDTILYKTKIGSNYINPINHSIIKLINGFSKKLIKSEPELKDKHDLSNNLLGLKQEKSPFIEYLDKIEFINSNDQYYLENFYLFTITEPCFMCAMALVHSRVGRVYYLNDNSFDGAFKSKLKISNYNLNHSYSIFKINI